MSRLSFPESAHCFIIGYRNLINFTEHISNLPKLKSILQGLPLLPQPRLLRHCNDGGALQEGEEDNGEQHELACGDEQPREEGNGEQHGRACDDEQPRVQVCDGQPVRACDEPPAPAYGYRALQPYLYCCSWLCCNQPEPYLHLFYRFCHFCRFLQKPVQA